MPETVSVSFENVAKQFTRGGESVKVLDRINFSLEPGEFVALMGPSGSGKSTLLNLASGLDKPSGGRVLVGGVDVSTMNDSALCKWRANHVGFIFQRYHLLPVLTAHANVEVPLLLFKMSKAERTRRVNTALELVGLTNRSDHFPKQLSGGQEQRVAIARSIVADPTLILADEPTGDLDAVAAGEILDLLLALNQRLNKTILMVTHDPKAAQRTHRILHLDKGVISSTEQGSTRRAARPA